MCANPVYVQSCGGTSEAKVKEWSRGPPFTNYTPLTIPSTKILKQALSSNLLPAPRRKPNSRNVDDDKHCLCHKNLGRTTEEILTLCDKVEELIQVGHLKSFIKKDRADRSPLRKRNPLSKEVPVKERGKPNDDETRLEEETEVAAVSVHLKGISTRYLEDLPTGDPQSLPRRVTFEP